MDYHLNQQGQTLGVFPLEELRRRRQTGELTGAELVWCEGMAAWQSLDAVLQRETPPVIPAPPLLRKAPSKVVPILMTVAVVLAVCVAVFGIVVVKFIRRIQPILKQAASGSTRVAALTLASQPIQWSSNTLTAAQMLETAKRISRPPVFGELPAAQRAQSRL